jgi:hypothetical protein
MSKFKSFLRSQLPYFFKVIDSLSKKKEDGDDYTDVDITKLTNIYKHSKVNDPTQVQDSTAQTKPEQSLGQKTGTEGDRSQFYKTDLNKKVQAQMKEDSDAENVTKPEQMEATVKLNMDTLTSTNEEIHSDENSSATQEFPYRQNEVEANTASSENIDEKNEEVQNNSENKDQEGNAPTLPSMVFKNGENIEANPQVPPSGPAPIKNLEDIPEETVNILLDKSKKTKGTILNFAKPDFEKTGFLSKFSFLAGLFNRGEDVTRVERIGEDKTLAGHDETVRLKTSGLTEKKSFNIKRFALYTLVLGGLGAYAYMEYFGQAEEQIAQPKFKKKKFKRDFSKVKKKVDSNKKNTISDSGGATDAGDMAKGMSKLKELANENNGSGNELKMDSSGSQARNNANNNDIENRIRKENTANKIMQNENTTKIQNANSSAEIIDESIAEEPSRGSVSEVKSAILDENSIDNRNQRAEQRDSELELSEKLVEKIENKYRKKTGNFYGEDGQDIDINYRRKGRGLVYNCAGKHWACVDKTNYFRCKKSANYRRKGCQNFGVYASKRYCQLAQIKKINSNDLIDFCD